LIIIKLQKFKIDDELVSLLIPMCLSWIPLLIWQRPRIKLLNLKTDGRKDPVAGILFLNWATLGIPLIISQMYMVTATGKLTRLNFMSDIDRFPATKYYRVKHYYTNKRMVHGKTVFRVTGKYNNDFDMYIYAAVPVFDHLFPDTNLIAAMRNKLNVKALIILNGKLSNMQLLRKLPADSIRMMRYVNPTSIMRMYGDTGKYGALAVVTRGYKMNNNVPPPKISPIAWLAIKYYKTISNHLSIAEKQDRYKIFATQSDTDFRRKHLDKFVYLDRIPDNSKDAINYSAAIKLKGDVVNDKEPTVLLPVYDPFEARNGNKLLWIFVCYAIGASIFLLILNFVALKSEVHSSGT
jgi:hypothetical protein